MVSLLARFFIKDYKNTNSPNVRESYGILCGFVGIALNVLLFLGKFFAGTLSHSISITADAFNNLSDAGSSTVTLIGFKLAGQKPDTNHPFGHGRLEYISGLIVSGAILLMAFELIRSSVGKVIHPETIEFSLLATAILIISICVKLYMAYYNNQIAKRFDSAAMKATATDSLSDSIATCVVLLASFINKWTGYNIDGYCGILVGLFILYAGISAAKDTLNPLLGQPPKREFVDQIYSIVLAHKEILDIHDLIVHDYGPGRVMISLHAEVSSDGNILFLHDIIDNVEKELKSKLSCDAVIHMDPVAVNDKFATDLKMQVISIIKGIDPILSLHDFRIVTGPTHTNIIFDLVIPFSYSIADEKLLLQIQQKMKELNPTYFAIIQIDRSSTL